MGKALSWGEEEALQSAKSRPVSESINLGALPKPGVWTKLSFDPAAVGLAAGTALKTLAVQQVGGIVAWDYCTLSGEARPATDPLASFQLWWKAAGKASSPEVPPALAKALSVGPDKVPDPAQQKALLDFYLTRIAHPVSDEIAHRRAVWEDAKARRAAARGSDPRDARFPRSGQAARSVRHDPRPVRQARRKGRARHARRSCRR